MASLSSIQVLLVLGLFSHCLVHGEISRCVREGVVDDYIETVVQLELELMKFEVEKHLEEKLKKLVNEKEQDDLKKATESKYK